MQSRVLFYWFLSLLVVSVLYGDSAFSQPETGVEDDIKELRQEIRELRKEMVRLREVFTKLVALAEAETKEAAPQLRLAAWNIRVFSDGSRDDVELQQIATVLIEYDFIAIVELRDERVLKRAEAMLEADMGRDYDYLISEPVGRGVKERYGFLYDPQMVEIIDEGAVYPDPEDVFIREPYFATFKAGEFDFTVIAMHAIWGDSVKARRRELQELGRVFQTVQDMDPAEQDVLLVGDFNRPPDDELAFGSLLSIPSMTYLFQPPQKSHIKDSSLYDNIFFQAVHLTEYTGERGIDMFDETYFQNDDDAALKAVSDHRPVWAVFRTDMIDDD